MTAEITRKFKMSARIYLSTIMEKAKRITLKKFSFGPQKPNESLRYWEEVRGLID